MSSLPTTRKIVPAEGSSGTELPAGPNDLSLEAAFASFTEAAGSLETFYSNLSSEVVHLRERLDETNRELSESLEANQRMRLHLERVVASLPCGVLVLDAAGARRLVNPEVYRLLEAIDPDSLEAALDSLVGRLEELGEGETSGERQLELEGAIGARCIGVRSKTLPGRERSDDETIWILRDLTDEKHLQEEMEAARRVQALADMAGLLAHEIRNPLGSLELFASLIADDLPEGGESREWADQLQAGLRTLGATVNNVLQFHSASGGPRTPLDVVDLLSETIEFLAPMARQWNTEVRLSSSGRGGTIVADRQGLRQVFMNLAINAFNAMPSGGVLEVSVHPGNEGGASWTRIEFTDQGRGIAPEDLDDLFRPGYSTKPGSSGLGLFVCRGIVEKSGGEVAVSSVLNQGTTFALSFRSIGEAE